MNIEVPYEFEQFVKFFYPGSNDGVANHKEWIEQNFAFHNAGWGDVIRRFLDELLSDLYRR